MEAFQETIDDDFCNWNWIASELNYDLLSSMEFSETTESNDDDDSDDFCNSILSQFGNSSDDDDQIICAVIVAMSKSLKEKKVPCSPVAYLYATCSSLDNLEPPDFLIDALFIILSMVIVRVPVSVLKKKKEYLSKLVLRILQYRLATKTSIILGLKWFSYSLTYTDGLIWSHVSPFIYVLLGFLTDSRRKVRQQSHLCLRDVLLNFQNSPLLSPLSEYIFERCILPAADDPTKGVKPLLYILDALEKCLPILSSEYQTSVLKYFKSVLDMSQPRVTRRITDVLMLLCLYPTSEFSPDALLELLTSFARSISSNEMSLSGDGMTVTVRLLDTGINKVYSLNKQICVSELPTFFNALKDVLTSQHEEAICAATTALKNIINSCIDETLIKQGVDIITLEENKKSRTSGPTIIEKICATIESLLDHIYVGVWDRVFEVVSSMFHKLGSYSPYLMRGILKNLEYMQKLPDEDFPFRKQLHVCLGSALVAIGPENLPSFVHNLNVEAEDLSEANIWCR
ncbi:uncharacterized protein LOC123906799 isoform X1 [Trifolium pratense]|uniref:uncharacterized protein LOC123906799 isoform X1 n=2 Tax=Trifolium pratense TaxID=57577 RepID=UPI001E697417|nr:uncharacterized protein LOC123906799 isoform X1 [Trifolium pratense]